MSALPRRLFTPEEYLLLENQAPYRSQYVSGEIFAMAGAEPEHVRIVGNINVALNVGFKDRPCESYASELRVKIAEADLYTYPDVVAFCGEGRYDRTSRPAMLLNPQVIFEVLSPATAEFDRHDKFRRYQALASLTDYVLVATDEMRVTHFARQPDGSWPAAELRLPDDRVPLRSLDVDVALAQIYRRVKFPGPA